MHRICYLILISSLVLPFHRARAQNPTFPCNNWLYLPPSPPYSSIQLGDLDVPGTQITVEAEFCRTTPYSGGPLYAGDLVSKHQDPSNVNYLLRPNDAEITTSNGYFQTPPVCDIALNITYHAAMTYDGATLKFYRNGILVSQVAATGTLFQNDYPTEIGIYFAQAFPTNFVGYINEVRIWNVVRTQAQIQAYMNSPLPNPTTQPGLQAYYTFGSLTNLQGNAAWNGTTVGVPQTGQTNPDCSAVILTEASFSLSAAVTRQFVCENAVTTLYGYFSGGINNPQYSWQVSLDSGKTWTDLPASNALRYDFTAPQVTNLTDVYYRLAVSDASDPPPSGCQILSSPVILTVSPQLNSEFTFAQDICQPLQVLFTGPSQTGVAYTWTVDGTDYPSSTPGSAVLSYTFSSFGTHQVTLTPAGSACSSPTTKPLFLQVLTADLITTKDTLVCAGKPVPLHTLPSLDFCWSPSTGLDNPGSPNPVASPAISTKYHFTAKTTGANLVANGDFSAGNTGFTSAYLYANPNSTEGQYFVGTNAAGWNGGMTTCGDHTTGTGNMMLLNGAPQAGTNVWTSQTMTVSPNTNYAFSVWIESLDAINPAILQFSINGIPLGNSISPNGNTCSWGQFYTTWNSGNSTTATISLVNNNTIRQGNDFALDDISFAPVLLQTDSITISVDAPTITVSPADTTVCPGMPVPLHAGGSTASYTWSPAAGLSNPGIADPVALVSSADTPAVYIVTGLSASGCTDTLSAHIRLFPRSASISPDTLICTGDPARLLASGGTGYSWSPPVGLDNPAIPDPVARPAATTMYTVTLTDIDRCIEKDSVTVHVKAVPLFHAPPDETVCEGLGVALKDPNPAGYVYSWSPSSGLDNSFAPMPVATPAADMDYTLHISDSVCAAYDSTFTIAVRVFPTPVIVAEKGNDIDCAIHLAPLTAAGGVSYVWSPSAGLSDPFSATPVASIDSTTTYVVKGTDANGCYAYDTLTVSVTSAGANTFVVPNAFTPNGDGHNDCFGVTRWGDVRLEQMDIFNRWGQLVFTTRNPSDCWDGGYNGRPQPAGVYVYVIRAHTFCGDITRTGTVMLIR